MSHFYVNWFDVKIHLDVDVDAKKIIDESNLTNKKSALFVEKGYSTVKKIIALLQDVHTWS